MLVFFFNGAATTEIYTLSLHDALPILAKLDNKTIAALNEFLPAAWSHQNPVDILGDADAETYRKTLQIVSQDENTDGLRSEEHTSELQSPDHLVCRLLLEKNNTLHSVD